MTTISDNLLKADLGPRISVGMSAYGNHEVTLQALRHLFNSASGDFELLLVDDCSPDEGKTLGLFEQVRCEHPNTRIFSFDRNLEYSGSLNAILSHASGEFIFFVSNDIFVTPAYFAELLEVARSDPRHGIVRGCANFVDNGLPSHNCAPSVPITHPDDLFGEAERIRSAQRGKLHLDDYLTGDAFLVARAVIDKIGTLDPLFFGYFADHDFGLRAQIAGFDLVLAQGAYSWHKQDANFDYLDNEERQRKLDRRWRRIWENWARFKLKYGVPVELDFPGVNAMSWTQWRAASCDPDAIFCAPGDYSRYVI